VGFKNTRYLGGHRYESKCIRCEEMVRWADGDGAVHMVFYPNEDIGVLCAECYRQTHRTHAPSRHR
jgi:hypothetical protein